MQSKIQKHCIENILIYGNNSFLIQKDRKSIFIISENFLIMAKKNPN